MNEPNNTYGSGGKEGDVVHHATRMVGEAKAFGNALSDAGTRINQSIDLSGRVQRNPIAMVLAAAGVGYVLGGGLFSNATGKALKVGLRLALIPFLKGQISALAASKGNAGEPL